ncbi:CsgG/HfaB family protein [Candidatus Venteria ishoeyi]|uniref:Curli production assembly/transport component CsgG n=1 Tax=Candidatus Venteria ishoeyi TaxID=1899563 RepID=A0A1H6F447_9GAMM|nr:CsgG/HfaB family protein [Candidatus Venteria ishoeyi]SEH04890.1 Curli production assembly/transport component CsgG [Candidatus Venteria ishoeyi]
MKILKTLSVATMACTLVACSDDSVKPTNEVYKKPTIGFVIKNSSVYSKGLECLGNLITQDGQAGNNGVTVSIGLIQDKTARQVQGSPLTQAASDMTLTAMTRVGAIDLVGTTDTRDILQYDLSSYDLNTMANTVSLSNVGSLIKSDVFITGAITEYNKDVRDRSWGMGIFGKLLGLDVSGDDSIINVSMDLRLVNPKTGRVLRSGQGQLLAISLQNNIVSSGFDTSATYASSSFGLTPHFSSRSADPQHLAIRELIERSVLILMGSLYGVNWQQCDSAQAPPPPQAPTSKGLGSF